MKDGFQIFECAACGHQLAEPDDPEHHVERIYDDEYFSGGGAGYSDYINEGSLIRAAGRRYAHILARYTTTGRILDVGAAAGFFLKGFEDCGWQGTGIEPNATMARYAQEVLGIHVVKADLETVHVDEKFDVVSAIQVIAHFQEPGRAMQIISSIVRPGGYVLIESWNRSSFAARVFGRQWHEYSPPSVLHWFSRDGLIRLGQAAGLILVRHGRPLKMLNGAHARSLIKYKLSNRPATAAMSKLVDLIPGALPIIYPLDDPIWILLWKPSAMCRPERERK